MKTRHENYMTDYIDVVYAKNKTNLFWLIKLGADCDKN